MTGAGTEGRQANWAGNLTYHAARLHRPTTVDEVREIVARSTRVKALGSRHCFNDIADTTGDLVVLAALPGAVEFDLHDDGNGTVVVPGGMRRRIVCATPVTWAVAEAMSTSGWK